MFYMAGGTILSYMSHELAVAAVSDTTSNIYSLIYSLNGYSNAKLNLLLDEMDVLSKIQIVEALIKEISEDKYKKNSSLSLALHHLHKVVEEIELQLGEMDEVMKTHKNKWFSSWRGLDFDVNKLKLNFIKMDKRLEMFINLLNIKY